MNENKNKTVCDWIEHPIMDENKTKNSLWLDWAPNYGRNKNKKVCDWIEHLIMDEKKNYWFINKKLNFKVFDNYVLYIIITQYGIQRN
jgi:hypothetical protein